MARKSDIKLYSKHNEEKSIVAERFIRNVESKMYKQMTSVSKMYILIN